MSNPLVSVLLPTYNMASSVGRAIDSILAQTFTDFELLILNDGSTDATADLLAQYAEADSRVVVVDNAHNIGLIRTLNKGLKLARGVFVARQDADNYSFPSRFAKQTRYLTQHPDVGLVATQVYVAHNETQTTSHNCYPHFVLPPALISWEMRFYPYFAHDSIMARRDILLQVGGYRLDRVHAEDYDLWVRLCDVTQLAVLPEPLTTFYHNPDGVSYQYAELQNRTTLEIMRDAASDLLGEPVSEADTNILFQIARANSLSCLADLRRAEQLLPRLRDAYLEAFVLTTLEKELLNANLMSKLANAQVQCLSKHLNGTM